MRNSVDYSFNLSITQTVNKLQPRSWASQTKESPEDEGPSMDVIT